LVAALCSVEATLQGASATPARHHRGTLHCNNHSSTGDSISSERQAFQVPSLHHVEEESSQAIILIFTALFTDKEDSVIKSDILMLIIYAEAVRDSI